jgi:hypothetical protein
VGPAPLLFDAWVRFHAGFDAGLAADRSAGKPEPIEHKGSAASTADDRGGALRLGVGGGGTQLTWETAGNLDLARPGALACWVRGLGWQAEAPPGDSGYVRLVRVPGAGRSVFLVERDVRRAGATSEAFVVGFFDLAGGEEHSLVLRPGPLWRPTDWHLLVVTWDARGFAVSVDGAALVRQAVPEGRIRANFADLPDGAGSAGAAWIVGDAARESTLLDDLTVYARVLDDDEVRRLYAAGRAAGFTR